MHLTFLIAPVLRDLVQGCPGDHFEPYSVGSESSLLRK
ncbi:hypothetical protein E2I00_018263, partial [Balaenoptera physalus]